MSSRNTRSKQACFQGENRRPGIAANHPKVKLSIKFTRPEHNIYKIKETSVDITTHWQIKDKDGKTVNGKVRGHYTHVYESTAAFGGTIFWKYSTDFIKATGNKECD